MPRVNGLEVLKRIRRRKTRQDLPIIMVTGRDCSSDVARALQAGANDYLTKPIDFEEAAARISTQLELHRAQKELSARMAEIQQLARDLQVRNAFIQQVFGRYVTDEIVRSILETPGGLQLGGQRRTVTILMSDLRGFTAVVENHAPEKVVEVLNVHLRAMAEVINRHGGVIDEFIGDAILAIFGAPLSRPDHVEAAVACALQMQKEMERVNRTLLHLHFPPLEMGIGVHTGEVVAGNIGSKKRAKYAVVGSSVNLTGRIQSASVGGEVLVSDAVARALGSRLIADRSFSIAAKGLAKDIELFNANGLRGMEQFNLPSFGLTSVPSGPAIPVHCFKILESKTVFSQPSHGQLLRVSPHAGYLATAEALEVRSDIKLKPLVKTSGTPAEIYCKVMDERAGPVGVPVHFSSPWPNPKAG